MKKFILMILAVSVFFIGIGGLVDRAGARFKSDERALAVIAQARAAIGGEAAIKNVRSMTIVGSAAQSFTVDGVTRTEQGNLEIAFQLPGQFSKMLKIGSESEVANGGAVRRETKVIISTKDDDKAVLNQIGDGGEKRVFVVRGDGEGKTILSEKESGDVDKRIMHREVSADASHMRQNDLIRTTFALLLSAPEGSDANYTYAGESSIDGKNCDVILAQSGGSTFKLFIEQSSHLPLMLSYQNAIPVVFKFNREEMRNDGDAKKVIINKDGTQNEIGDGKIKVFARKLDAPEATAEIQVKFSDYRNVNGIQLPYKWTQTANGQLDQNVDVTSYEINPANIADKFRGERTLLKMRKSQ